MPPEGLQTTIFLIVFLAAAGAVAWVLTRRGALFGKKPAAPAPPPPVPTPEVDVPQPPSQAAAPPPYPGASAQSPPPPVAAMPMPSPAPVVKAEEYQALEERLREVEALLGRLALQRQAPLAAPTAYSAAPAPPPQQPVREEVYRLADDGAPAGDIARRLSLSRSEVELLLKLRRLRGMTRTAEENNQSTAV